MPVNSIKREIKADVVGTFELPNKYWKTFNSIGSKIMGILDVGGNDASLAIYRAIEGEIFDWHSHLYTESLIATAPITVWEGEEHELEDGTYEIRNISEYNLTRGQCLYLKKGPRYVHKAKFHVAQDLVLVWCPALLNDTWVSQQPNSPDPIHQFYSEIKEFSDKALSDYQMIASAVLDDRYLNCFMKDINDSEERLALTGKRWHQLLNMSKDEIAATPIESIMYPDDNRDWALSKLRMRSEFQNKKGNVFPRFVNKWQGKGEPFYVEWLHGTKISGRDDWFFIAYETTENEYLDFIKEFKDDRGE